MATEFRRVVTGHDDDGRSIVISDGPAPTIHTSQLDPQFASADLFRTDAAPVPVVACTPETTGGPRRQLPANAGTVFRINCFPPESEFQRTLTPEGARLVFAALGNEEASTYAEGGRHPLMHRTETIDYAIVIQGEITMVLDDDDVVLRAGDVAIQCGTNHAWSNRSNEIAVVAFVLIDGEYDTELAKLIPPRE